LSYIYPFQIKLTEYFIKDDSILSFLQSLKFFRLKFTDCRSMRLGRVENDSRPECDVCKFYLKFTNIYLIIEIYQGPQTPLSKESHIRECCSPIEDEK